MKKTELLYLFYFLKYFTLKFWTLITDHPLAAITHLYLHYVRHDVPQVLVNAPKARLLFGEGASPKDRLQVNPLPLHQIQIVQTLVERAQFRLPHHNLVLEVPVVRRVFKRRKQGLIIANGTEQILPVFDDGSLGALRVLELGQHKLGARAPQLQLP